MMILPRKKKSKEIVIHQDYLSINNASIITQIILTLVMLDIITMDSSSHMTPLWNHVIAPILVVLNCIVNALRITDIVDQDAGAPVVLTWNSMKTRDYLRKSKSWWGIL